MSLTDEEIRAAVKNAHALVDAMPLDRIFTMLMDDKVMQVSSQLNSWLLGIEKKGLEYTVKMAIGKECEDDRGWWVQVTDPVRVKFTATSEQLNKLRSRLET